MAILQTLGSMNLLYWFVTLLFDFLILCMFVRAILSFLTMLSPANPFVRFFTNITGPIYDPIYRLMPRMLIGMLDMSATVAFIFVWWALTLIQGLALSALPQRW